MKNLGSSNRAKRGTACFIAWGIRAWLPGLAMNTRILRRRKSPHRSKPPFDRTVRDTIEPRGGKCRVNFMDEARFGQQGTLTRTWAARGSRPTAVKQTRYEWVYMYAAVEPKIGASVALQAPQVNTETMNVFLKMLSRKLRKNAHAVLIMDQAGWLRAKHLVTPDNITVLYLPS